MQVEILRDTRAQVHVCVCASFVNAPGGANRLRKTLYQSSYREADPLSQRVPILPGLCQIHIETRQIRNILPVTVHGVGRQK